MDIKEKIKDVCNVVITKSKEVGKSAKINIDIMTLESKINDCMKNIGKEVYDENIKVDDEIINANIDKISKYKKDIEKKKKLLKTIKE